jgi:CDP-glucose 4,6-dehydratase
MVNVSPRFQSLRGKKVFVTGHTGFTGSWASIWLNQLGCDAYGYSLEPETTPNLFTEAKVRDLVPGKIADIRDFETLKVEISKFQPDLVLHLAAQPLVRRSYRIPRETFEVNAQGTANLLEASSGVSSIKGILCITTDKVYKNLEEEHSFSENDELGGSDPYSASKAAAELIISSYRASVINKNWGSPVISVARGGNIVGGGDWSEDRLVPDFMRAYEAKQPLKIRFPHSTRPWQHVISLIEGYFSILEGMIGGNRLSFNQAFNLGPLDAGAVTVAELLGELSTHIPGVKIEEGVSELTEARRLSLNSTLARETFGWNPTWSTPQVIKETAAWYRDYLISPSSARELCKRQIAAWSN